jgi:hypothetical protein
MGGGRWSSGKYVGTTCLRAAGSSPAPPAVGILASDMAYGVVMQVFLCQQWGVSAFRLRLRPDPLLFIRFDARA